MKCSSLGLRALSGALLFTFAVGNALALEKFQAASRAAAGQEVEFDVFLPLQHVDELDQLLVALHTPGSASYHKWLTPDQFRQSFGPKREDIAKVTNALSAYGLTVTKTHSHGIRVKGQINSIENAFATSLWNGVSASGAQKLIATSPLSLPAALSQAGAQVVHFSPSIRHTVHARRAAAALPDNRKSPVGPYWFTDLKQAYDFPSYEALTGKGVTIGILISSDYLDSDMTTYFGHEGLNPPTIIRRPVLGGAPFSTNSGASLEVSLDIQQSGGMAPGATIVIYNIPTLGDDAVLAGYLDIVEDNMVDIVNSSFGGPEAQYTAAYNAGVDFTGILNVFSELFKQGNAQGITFVASSGDSGGLGAPPVEYFTTAPQNPPKVTGYFLPGIEHPASNSNVTAVGGTNLVTTFDPTDQSLESAYLRENADGDPEAPYDPFGLGNLIGGGYWGGGGGKSVVFKKPDYQKLVKTGSTYRTVPDLSLHMGGCPDISYQPCGPDRSAVYTVWGGKLFEVIGTSAAAPDFVGLLALREEYVPGRIGNVNYIVYKLAQEQFQGAAANPYFHTGVPGFNGYYHTHAGYNYVLGNGTVYGKNFIDAPDLPSAGDPLTPSNP